MHVSECDDSVKSVVNNPKELPLVHQWILSRTAATIKDVRSSLDEYRFNDVASANYQFIWHEYCDWYLEWIKADLFSDNPVAKKQAQGCLLVVLETILKLIHPVTPFVSEEIWSVLPGERELLVTSSFPELQPTWKNEKVDAEMEVVMGIITGIRNIRSEADIHPSTKIEALIICSDVPQVEMLKSHGAAISDMTRLSGFTVSCDAPKPDDAATYIYNDIEIFVPLKGLVDVQAELDKLTREEKKIEGKYKQVSGKLSNEKFLSNAPDAVVEKVQQEKAALDAKLAKIAEAKERLNKMA